MTKIMNSLKEQIKSKYVAGWSKLYYCQDPNSRNRNTIQCKKCARRYAYYDRRDFDKYSDIPDICQHCAASEAWWDSKPYFEIWIDK